MKKRDLTTKQRLFVEAYLANPNATEAAIKAGYSKKTAGSVGAENLKKPEIAALLEKRVEDAIITANDVLTGVKEIAVNRGERSSDRLKAYELLGKHLAMWTDKVEQSGKSTIEIEYVNDWRG